MRTLHLKIDYIADIMHLDPISDQDEILLNEIDSHTDGKISSEAIITIDTLKELIELCFEKDFQISITP